MPEVLEKSKERTGNASNWATEALDCPYLKVLPGLGYYCFHHLFQSPRLDLLVESNDENISAKPLLVVGLMKGDLTVLKAYRRAPLLIVEAFQMTGLDLDQQDQHAYSLSVR